MQLPRAVYQDCAPVAPATAQLLMLILCYCLVACAELSQHSATVLREGSRIQPGPCLDPENI